jgi:ATP synthase protein I
MSDEHDAERLRALEAKLAAKRKAPETAPAGDAHSQAHMAWRMVIELVAGLGIGFGIGYGLDVLLGTQPWLMVVFTLLGFAAGVKTVISSAQEMQAKAVQAALEDPGAGAPKDEDR